MKKSGILIILIACFFLSSGADIYVNHSGSDNWPYDTEAKGSTSIQRALDTAEAGDTVWIKADQAYAMNGTDQAAAQIDIDLSSDITIKGYYLTLNDQDSGGDYYKDLTNGWAVIDANETALSILKPADGCADIVFENLKFIGLPHSGTTSISIDLTDAVGEGGIQVRNVWCDGGSYGIKVCEPDGLLITDSWFTGNWYIPSKGDDCGCSPVYINSPTYGTVINNCIFEPDTDANFVQCIRDEAYGGTTIMNCIINNRAKVRDGIVCAYVARIMNNVIYDSNNMTNGIELKSTIKGGVIFNNIIWGVTNAINDKSSRNSYQDYNCYSGNIEINGIATDPLFKDAANGDFRLNSNSLCLNAGLRPLGNGFSDLGRTTIGTWQPYAITAMPKGKDK